jgi:hypothetical protein
MTPLLEWATVHIVVWAENRLWIMVMIRHTHTKQGSKTWHDYHKACVPT